MTAVSGGAPPAATTVLTGKPAVVSGSHVYALPITASGDTTGKSRWMTLQLTMQAFVAPPSAAEQAQLSAASGK